MRVLDHDKRGNRGVGCVGNSLSAEKGHSGGGASLFPGCESEKDIL